MKFSDTVAYGKSHHFRGSVTRNPLDQIVLFKLINQYKFKKLLEIGYFEGLTFSILYEASHHDAKLTACDITFDHDVLSKILKFTKTVNFRSGGSEELRLSGSYDFINIDGEHSYTAVQRETALIQNHFDNLGILMIDDYQYPGVHQALVEFTDSSDFVPFLLGPQQMFLQKQSRDIDWLINDTKGFCSWENTHWNNFPVKKYNYKNPVFIDKLPQLIERLGL